MIFSNSSKIIHVAIDLQSQPQFNQIKLRVYRVLRFEVTHEYDTQTPQEENKSETTVVMFIILSPNIVI